MELEISKSFKRFNLSGLFERNLFEMPVTLKFSWLLIVEYFMSIFSYRLLKLLRRVYRQFTLISYLVAGKDDIVDCYEFFYYIRFFSIYVFIGGSDRWVWGNNDNIQWCCYDNESRQISPAATIFVAALTGYGTTSLWYGKYRHVSTTWIHQLLSS